MHFLKFFHSDEVSRLLISSVTFSFYITFVFFIHNANASSSFSLFHLHGEQGVFGEDFEECFGSIVEGISD
jgi:hypothetical protein